MKGFNLIELVIGMLLGAVVLGVAISFVRSGTNAGSTEQASQEQESELTSLSQLILQTGRGAEGPCSNPTTQELRCTVNTTVPKTIGNNTNVRFLYQAGTRSLLFEKENPPLGSNSWRTEKRFTFIDEFEVCADTQMKAGTCKIFPVELSNAHKNNTAATAADPTPASRFFRYRIASYGVTGKAKALETSQAQGAFFVRLPLPASMNASNQIGGAISYEWGIQR